MSRWPWLDDVAEAKREAALEAHLEHIHGVCGGDCPEDNRAFARWRFAQADPKDDDNGFVNLGKDDE